ncbi:prephenate dehydrogenase [Planctomycetota bacterium]
MKDLKQITVIGLGLLGGSITLTIKRCLPSVKVVGYTHRPATRKKARNLAVAAKIFNKLTDSVSNADLVILATPICTFENIFSKIADSLPIGCIVTDVGSTKVLAHRWARRSLPKTVNYVGSHPIAGSEQRGVEFARDDLFEKATCILTTTNKSDPKSVRTLKKFWSTLGCNVKLMTPVRHDNVFANISHLPHIAAASLINANDNQTLKFAGTGLIDTSRIASSPPNIWTDIFATNAQNCIKAIDKIIAELKKLRKALNVEDKKQIEKILRKAKRKRTALMNYKMKKKELIS